MDSGKPRGRGDEARKEAPRAANVLGTLLEGPAPRRLSEPQVRIILDALAGARDPALVVRFPAVLALCGAACGSISRSFSPGTGKGARGAATSRTSSA